MATLLSSDINETLNYLPERLQEDLDRAGAELRFANDLCLAHPDKAEQWYPLIAEASARLKDALAAPSVDVQTLIKEIEDLLDPLRETAKSYTLMAVGHAHIDMNWLWSWPETVNLTHDTFETMLTLMDEFPQFVFSQSQASVYEIIEKYNPSMFKRIQQRVKEGRWEVTASQWVEGDKNMASGESLSRHLLYSRAYFLEKFGLSAEDVQIDFEPDTFGHAATIPTILNKGGVKYYYHCRGSEGPHLYWWVGPDGSRLLVFHDIQWYMHHDAAKTSLRIAANAAEPLLEFAQATGLKVMPVLYGVGDHGGGPTRRDIRMLIDMDTWPIFPRVKFSRLQDFYKIAEKEAVDLPVITGERNFIFEGCYSSQARQKEANRHGENLLYTAELTAALGSHLADAPYPKENLTQAWKNVLFDQFHDILPGSGIRETREYTLGHAQESQAAASMARTQALRALAGKINTVDLLNQFGPPDALRVVKNEREAGVTTGAGIGWASGAGGATGYSAARSSDRIFVIFNPLPFERREVITVALWDCNLDLQHLVATTSTGEPQYVQVMAQGKYAGHHYTTVAFPVTVAALGYQTVCVSDRLLQISRAPAGGLTRIDPHASRTRKPIDVVLENAVLKAEVDPATGSIVSLVDKVTGREWANGEPGLGILQFCQEQDTGNSAWVIGQLLQREDLSGGKLARIHNGPHVQTLRWTKTISNSKIEMDISLWGEASQITFELHVDWREMGKFRETLPHLRTMFPLKAENITASFEIPYGSIERETSDGLEVPALRWVDAQAEDGMGMTLVNRSKYGFTIEGNRLGMTLLRATTSPDPLPDLGEHTIHYALHPHGPEWTPANSTVLGEQFNIPLVCTSSTIHEGPYPAYRQFMEVLPENVRLVAVKQAENGAGLVLRFAEVNGEESRVTLRLSHLMMTGIERAALIDTLEQELSAVTLDAGEVIFDVSANSIQSLYIGK